MRTVRAVSAATRLALGLSLVLGASRCAGDDTTGEVGTGGSASGGSAGSLAGQTSGGQGMTEEIPTFNGCAPAAFEDRTEASATRTIAIAGAGLTFTPKCLSIKAGQTVRWQGSLAAHPIAPGNPADASAGSAMNPIVETSSGQSVEFTFPDAGTFPYYCELHAFGAGQGMAGVVHVRP